MYGSVSSAGLQCRPAETCIQQDMVSTLHQLINCNPGLHKDLKVCLLSGSYDTEIQRLQRCRQLCGPAVQACKEVHPARHGKHLAAHQLQSRVAQGPSKCAYSQKAMRQKSKCSKAAGTAFAFSQ